MHYSFSSVLMAFITSNILLIVISLCLQSKKIMVNAGYKLLALFLGFTFLRFLFPVELPFANYLPLPKVLSAIVQPVKYHFYSFGRLRFSVWTILQFIWLVGILVNAIKKYRVNTLSDLLVALGKDLTNLEPYASVLAKVCRDKERPNVFRVVELNGIQTPMLYGISSPCILLPKGMSLSRKDLYYSFSHEISHHYHHDLIVGNIFALLKIIYWWNPASKTLKERVDLIIEMRIDEDLISAGPEVMEEYLRCLTNIKEYTVEQKLIADTLAASFLKDDNDELTKRFDMMSARNQRKSRSLNVLITTIILSVYVLSYVFIFEAYYFPLDAPDILIPSYNNSYLIDNGDGTYDFYLEGVYIETTDSLNNYFKDVPIYTKEKEDSND